VACFISSHAAGGAFDVYLYDPDTDHEPTQVGKGFIKIDSLESTNTFRTFKAAFFIGVIAIIIGFSSWYQDYRHYRNAALR